jgi:hypothetical protein
VHGQLNAQILGRLVQDGAERARQSHQERVMIPKGATDTPPCVSGPHRVYLPRTHAKTIAWAFWSVERQLWSCAYIGPITPAFDVMEDDGRLKWREPGMLWNWINEGEPGSSEHLARAIRSAS